MRWIAFAAVVLLDSAVTVKLIPFSHRVKYAQHPKAREYWWTFVCWHLIWIIAAIQSFVAPVSPPAAMTMTGLIALVLGDALVIWARRVNPRFLPTIAYVAPENRVKDGPYKLMAHPGYWGMIHTAIGLAWLLGQWWAVFPMVAYVALILRRMIKEDRLLSKQQSI